MTKARVFVTLKPGVLDPQGKAVAGGLEDLGYEGIADVRVGKLIEITLEEADPERLREQIDAMCTRLLANPVIEEYSFELESETEAAAPLADRSGEDR